MCFDRAMRNHRSSLAAPTPLRLHKCVRRAFSFVEVMIVIVIIGLLAGAVTLSTRHYLDRAKATRAKADLATFRSALESYYGEFGKYPSNDEGLNALVPKYIDKLRKDPWGNAYQYNIPGRSGAYEVISLGGDGRGGGEGVDADIVDEETVVAQERK